MKKYKSTLIIIVICVIAFLSILPLLGNENQVDWFGTSIYQYLLFICWTIFFIVFLLIGLILHKSRFKIPFDKTFKLLKIALLFTTIIVGVGSFKYSNDFNKWQRKTSHFIETYKDDFNHNSPVNKTLKNGDIIFQVSKSSQSIAIQKATHSKYSHVGLIFIENGKEFVFEASNVVKKTPLEEWINRGEGKHYVVKRLINSDSIIIINQSQLNLRRESAKYIDKPYDLHFDWSDDKMYCSELVWKIYKQGLDIEVGALEEMKDFDFTSKEVAKIIKARYSDSIPLNEKVISPVSIYNSDKLITVIDR